MECRFCGKQISVLDKKCPHCNTSTTAILDGGASGRSLLNHRAASPGPPASHILTSGDPPLAWKLNSGKTSNVNERKIADHMLGQPGGMELYQISQFVFNSPHVQNNVLYRNRASQVTLLYESAVNIVNAYATDCRINTYDTEPPLIVIYGGIIHAMALTALGLGYNRKNNSPVANQMLVKFIQKIGVSIVQSGGKFSGESATQVLEYMELIEANEDYDIQSWARSYRAAMTMGVISHELGHLALGHTLGRSLNMEISRNQEREADSFSASVISSSPFSDYLVHGSIFFWVILSWLDAIGPESPPMSHPHPRERLFDFIRANKDQSAAIGITERTIIDFLPDQPHKTL